MALYLGIDLSTQGVKAELIDPENPAAGSGGLWRSDSAPICRSTARRRDLCRTRMRLPIES